VGSEIRVWLDRGCWVVTSPRGEKRWAEWERAWWYAGVLVQNSGWAVSLQG
jgi:hypothetical protein